MIPGRKISGMKTRLCILSVAIVLVTGSQLAGQAELKGYIDAGQNTVSAHGYMKTGLLTAVSFESFTGGSGLLVNLQNGTGNGISGYNFNLSRKFRLKDVSFVVEAYYAGLPFYDMFIQTDKGLRTDAEFRHFSFVLGADFKTFSFRRRADEKNRLYENSSISEAWNILYSFDYSLKPADNSWNLILSINDFDEFSFSQEINPVLNLTAKCDLSSRAGMFVKTGYRSSGMTNTNVNYFEFSFKAGLSWKIN